MQIGDIITVQKFPSNVTWQIEVTAICDDIVEGKIVSEVHLPYKIGQPTWSYKSEIIHEDS